MLEQHRQTVVRSIASRRLLPWVGDPIDRDPIILLPVWFLSGWPIRSLVWFVWVIGKMVLTTCLHLMPQVMYAPRRLQQLLALSSFFTDQCGTAVRTYGKVQTRVISVRSKFGSSFKVCKDGGGSERMSVTTSNKFACNQPQAACLTQHIKYH